MNERIKELDKQAKLWAIDNTNFPISSHIPAGYTEKFAELIVRECIGIVQPHISRWPEDCELVIKIKEHFGVEK